MNTLHVVLSLVLAAAVLPASAEIIFQHGVVDSAGRPYLGATTMPTILLVQEGFISPQVSYQMRHARAWSDYRRDKRASGSALAFTSVFSAGGASSYGQAVAREHVLRANAYRLGYYK